MGVGGPVGQRWQRARTREWAVPRRTAGFGPKPALEWRTTGPLGISKRGGSELRALFMHPARALLEGRYDDGPMPLSLGELRRKFDERHRPSIARSRGNVNGIHDVAYRLSVASHRFLNSSNRLHLPPRVLTPPDNGENRIPKTDDSARIKTGRDGPCTRSRRQSLSFEAAI